MVNRTKHGQHLRLGLEFQKVKCDPICTAWYPMHHWEQVVQLGRQPSWTRSLRQNWMDWILAHVVPTADLAGFNLYISRLHISQSLSWLTCMTKNGLIPPGATYGRAGQAIWLRKPTTKWLSQGFIKRIFGLLLCIMPLHCSKWMPELDCCNRTKIFSPRKLSE
jgi:hypothetical protein